MLEHVLHGGQLLDGDRALALGLQQFAVVGDEGLQALVRVGVIIHHVHLVALGKHARIRRADPPRPDDAHCLVLRAYGIQKTLSSWFWQCTGILSRKYSLRSAIKDEWNLSPLYGMLRDYLHRKQVFLICPAKASLGMPMLHTHWHTVVTSSGNFHRLMMLDLGPLTWSRRLLICTKEFLTLTLSTSGLV